MSIIKLVKSSFKNLFRGVKMYLCDLHMHSSLSVDGKEKIDDICKTAIDIGLETIALTEHFETSSEGPGDGHYFQNEERIAKEMEQAQERYKDKLEVLYGIEIGQPHLNYDQTVPLVKRHEFDHIIVSLHILKDGTDLYFADYSSDKKIKNILEIYFNEMVEMLDYSYGNSLGHLDYPLRVLGNKFLKPTLVDYYDLINEVLKKAVSKGIALEINTRGLSDWQKRVGPELWILKRYRELGGEMVTFGSDAHHLKQVGFGICEAAEAAKKAGFDYVTVFRKSKPSFIEI